jgi:hypothetical protein
MPSAAPKVVSAEVVAAQPTDADVPMIAGLSSEVGRRLPSTAFIVKVRLEEIPEPAGSGWALYVGATRIPKYWEYPGGIYFKVLDQTFLDEHRGEPLRFSLNDQKFVNTGVTLPGPTTPRAAAAARGARRLPLQSEVLADTPAPRAGAAPAAPGARTRKPRAAGRRRPARKSKKK